MDTQAAARHVAERMDLLRLKPRDLRPLGGPSEDTVRRLLRGEISSRVQAQTLQEFDVALGWRRGSLRSILFSGGEPTVANDYDAARQALNAHSPLDQGEWAAVPLWMVTDLAAMAAEAQILVRDETGHLAESIRRITTLTSDLLALVKAAQRSPEDLARLAQIVTRET